jgi:hypothetical protein
MEIINDRRLKEAEKNTVLALLENLDMLLLGMGTEKGKFKEKSQKEKIMLALKRIATYRLNEGIIQKGSKIGIILGDIITSKFNDTDQIENFYHSLLSISDSIGYGQKSEYFHQKKLEENEKKGEGILNKFFRFFTK